MPLLSLISFLKLIVLPLPLLISKSPRSHFSTQSTTPATVAPAVTAAGIRDKPKVKGAAAIPQPVNVAVAAVPAPVRATRPTN